MKLLVQLSDPHIKAPGSLAYGRVDTAAFLGRAVEAVLKLKQAPVAVVITGDLTDFGRAEEYAHLRLLLRPIVCPVFLMPGNHDDRAAMRQAFRDHAYLRHAAGESDSAFMQYAVDLDGCRLVTVDTVVPKASRGAVCAQRISVLDDLLSQDRNTPTIVAMHHPPFRTFIGHMDDIGLLEGANALRTVIERHPQVERVICGHLHRSIQTRWANTVAMTAPSTAHQVSLDLAKDAASTFSMEPPGFLVHAWSHDGVMATHEVAIGAFDGPYPFFEDGALID
jgi:3',5'-cyclic-AMP phosphodiesterase